MSQAQEVKESVKTFYEEVGWKKPADEVFEDANRFEDLRPSSADYLRLCHQRVRRHLAHRGRFILDVASGPIQRDDFLEYSQGYDYRVCVDLTMRALRGARQRIGNKGLFVRADITRLPFREGAFDGVVSLHTIYHVPAEEQARAFLELHRMLAPDRSGVVVYNWGKHSPLMLPFDALPHKIGAIFRSIARRFGAPAKGELELYFHPLSQRWLDREVASRVPVEVRVWRSLSPFFMKTLVPGNALGRWWLARIYTIEERLPHWLGRWGCYPMIVLRKPAA